jgi:hypothetical protein
MRSDVDLTNFTAGQLSPRMKGRVDHKAYFNGCDTLENFVVMPQGGITARPGALMVALTRNQAAMARMIPFVFSTIQAYMLEFSEQNIRVYMNDGVVLSGSTPVDIAVPYHTADLPQIKYTQSADTLFLVHPNYPPAQLTRTSHTAWTYTVLTFRDGPYLDINNKPNNVTPSGTTGAITLTWDNTQGLDNGVGLTGADVGRPVRVKMYGSWGWCLITGVTSPTVAQASVQAMVNNGAQGYLDGASWTAQTLYQTNTVVKGGDGVTYYIARVGGTSAAGNGPRGGGSEILDGSVIWSSLSARDASRLQRTTIYNINDVVQNAANDFFQCVLGGKSDSSTANEPSAAGAPVQVDGTVQWAYLSPFVFPTKTLNWAMGAWGGPNGYPFTVRLWQERLCFGGFPGFPNRVQASQSNDYTNMAPSKADGTVLASSSLDWALDSDQVDAINWMIGAGSAQAMQLGIGTFGSEHILQAATTSEALTPNSVQAYQETTYGSASNANPLRIGKAVLFVDRTGRKLREWVFYWQQNGYLGPDQLQISENISRAAEGLPLNQSGIADLAYQQSPYQVIWARRNDGALLSFTYDRDQQVFAPAQHQLGGSYFGAPPVVESIATIPSPDGTYDELWLEVARTKADGATIQRTVEVLTRYFDGDTIDNAFFVDGGLSSVLGVVGGGGLVISGLTNQAQPTQPPCWVGTGQVNSPSVAMSWAVNDVVRANGGAMVITQVIDSHNANVQVTRPLKSAAPAAPGGWSSTTPKNTFSGLSYLNGQQVWLWGDGADLGYVTVTGGSVTLPDNQKVSLLTAGFLAAPLAITMPWEPLRAGAAATQGKMKDIDRMYTRFHETRGARYGRRTTDSWTRSAEDKLTPMEDRQGVDLMDNAPPLNSGIYVLEPTADYDLEGQIIFTRDGAGPMTVTAVFARGEVAEMPRP